jgi:hypothetical protein
MGSISFNTNIVQAPDKSIIEAKKNNLTDNVVDASSKENFAKDFVGALKSGQTDIFIKSTDGIVHKMSLPVDKALIEKTIRDIESNPHFQLASINFKSSEKTTIEFKGNINSAASTLEKSNKNTDDGVWNAMNGGATTVDAPGKTKPAAWGNYLELSDNGAVKVHNQTKAQTDNFPKTKEDFQKMLVKDFDFNGSISAFKQNGGEKTFIDQMKKNRPEEVKNMGEKNFEILCKQVYSYATTGHDISGKTNIGEMQGMLRQLNPEIAKSSDSNTEMKASGIIPKDKFDKLPADEQKKYVMIGDVGIPKGDDHYGRATIMTTRQIGDTPVKTTVSTETMDFSLEKPFNGTTLIPPYPARVMIGFDVSGSMAQFPTATIKNMDKVVDQHPGSRIGILKFNGNSEGQGQGTLLKSADNSTLTQEDIKTMAAKEVQKSSGKHAESAFNAAIQCITQGFPKTGDPVIDALPKEVVIYADEYDKAPESYKELCKLAKDNNVKVTFQNPQNGKTITLDELQKNVNKHGGTGDFVSKTDEGKGFNIYKDVKTPPKNSW